MDVIKALCWKMKCTYARKKYTLSAFLVMSLAINIGLTVYIERNTNNIILPPIKSEPVKVSEIPLMFETVNILYTPVNKETESIMKKFTELTPKLPALKEVKGMENEKNMEEWLHANHTGTTSTGIGFGIVFKETTQTSLIYTIRCTNRLSWYTDQLISDGSSSKNAGYNYGSSGFLIIQYLVNVGYLAFIGVEEPNWKIQEFPFPARPLIEGLIDNQWIFVIAILTQLLPFYVLMINYVMKEKYKGEKELLVLNGVKRPLIFVYWIVFFSILFLIVSTISTFILKIPFYNTATISQTNWFVYWFLLLLHSVAMTFYILTVCSFFDKAMYAQVVVLFMMVLCFVVIQYFKPYTTSFLGVLVSFIPIGALTQGLLLIVETEQGGSGISFEKAFIFKSNEKHGPYPLLILIMLFSIFFYVLIQLYIDAIRPGKFGVGKPWHFIFSAFYKNLDKEEVIKSESTSTNRPILENVKLPIGIEVKNLYKTYGCFNAINNLTLDIYKNQITALLGHNGAGKTTLFYIISGIYAPSSGHVFYDKTDIFNDLDAYRESLGFCPQENLLLEDLTVKEQIIFFGMVKGLHKASIIESTKELLTKLAMRNKINTLPKNLSGGMRRKLCLANALVNNPPILLLDEPTSGLDPESRRNIWDVLLGLRENKIILISTHFMEEADVLGDRIAIIAHGELKCYGSAMFLKKQFGSGHKITVSFTKDNPKSIVKMAESYSFTRVMEFSQLKKITIDVPMDHTSQMSTILYQLENSIGSTTRISVSASSMEEVFLKVLENEGITSGYKEEDVMALLNLTEKQKGPLLYCEHFLALMYKRVLSVRYGWLTSIVMLVIVPILAALFVVLVSQSVVTPYDPPLKLKLYEYGSTNVLIGAVPNSPEARAFQSVVKDNKGKSTVNENLTSILFDAILHNSEEFKHNYIIAADLVNKTTVLYSPYAYHATAVAIDAISNYFIELKKPGSEIVTINLPYEFNAMSCDVEYVGDIVEIHVLWCLFILIILSSLGIFSAYPIMERKIGFTHLQKLTGVSPVMCWATNLLFDTMLACIIPILVIIVILIFDYNGIFRSAELLGVLFLMLLVLSIVLILLCYLSSFFFSNYDLASAAITFSLILLALAFYGAAYFIENSNVLSSIFEPLSPLVSINSICTIIFPYTIAKSRCERCLTEEREERCLEVQEPFLEHINVTGSFWALVKSICLIIILILALEYNLFQDFFHQLFGPRYKKSEKNEKEDEDVTAHREITKVYLQNLILTRKGKKPLQTLRLSTNSDKSKETDTSTIGKATPQTFLSAQSGSAEKDIALFVDGLCKKYNWKTTAVHDVNFSVENSHCFGLLGVNGAGKSTVFKMLTGSIIPTKGNAVLVSNQIYSLDHSIPAFIQNLGYCPQDHCLIKVLTARELLYIFAFLRGVKFKNAKQVVNWWIRNLDLHLYCDKRCGTYSGGNKRKLSTGLALIGQPKLILMDEPTTGVDSVTKRKLWQVFQLIKHTKQTMILTSHSMDECEVVCNKLTIMVAGRMKCIGDIQYLKHKFTLGFTIDIKVEVDASEKTITNIKKTIIGAYGSKCELKDEHPGFLSFSVFEVNFYWSKEFSKMDSLKTSTKGIEEYALSATSLEQVFLSFAKDGTKQKKNQQTEQSGSINEPPLPKPAEQPPAPKPPAPKPEPIKQNEPTKLPSRTSKSKK